MPPHNGVAKRKNIIIMDMARSMLKAKDIPNNFWAEAVSCSIYLLNRSPTKSLQNATPEEAWSGSTRQKAKCEVAHASCLSDTTPLA